jgi:uncharacterized protein (TIGR03067 family)
VAAAAEDDNKKDLKAMQGDWAAEEWTRDGFKLADDDARAMFRTVKDDTYTVHRFRKKAGSGKFKLDATKTPRQIDFFPDAPKGLVLEGIYKIDGDKLTICYAPKGKRPTEFASKEDSGATLTVWLREKKK